MIESSASKIDDNYLECHLYGFSRMKKLHEFIKNKDESCPALYIREKSDVVISKFKDIRLLWRLLKSTEVMYRNANQRRVMNAYSEILKNSDGKIFFGTSGTPIGGLDPYTHMDTNSNTDATTTNPLDYRIGHLGRWQIRNPYGSVWIDGNSGTTTDIRNTAYTTQHQISNQTTTQAQANTEATHDQLNIFRRLRNRLF